MEVIGDGKVSYMGKKSRWHNDIIRIRIRPDILRNTTKLNLNITYIMEIKVLECEYQKKVYWEGNGSTKELRIETKNTMLPLPIVCIALVNLFLFIDWLWLFEDLFCLDKEWKYEKKLSKKETTNCRHGLFKKCSYSTKIATPFYFNRK